MLTPVGLTIAAIVALGGTLLVVTGAGGEALSWLAEKFTELRDWIGKVVGGNTDALYQEGAQNNIRNFHELIRKGDASNGSVESGFVSNVVAIMGRMACESGQMITWDDAFASNLELAPGLEQLTMDADAPVLPDANGRYPIAIPGQTKVI